VSVEISGLKKTIFIIVIAYLTLRPLTAVKVQCISVRYYLLLNLIKGVCSCYLILKLEKQTIFCNPTAAYIFYRMVNLLASIK
jgi:hypothetical protein